MPADAPAPLRLRLVYSGRVQGVGFRATTESIARGHSVRGYVRNQDDGSVELVVEGEPTAVRTFLQAVATQFQRNIRSVREEKEMSDETFDGFKVRR